MQRWVKKIEEEVEANHQTALIDIEQPPPSPKPIRHAKPKTKSQVDELRAKVLALEAQLEEANFKALYYSTLVRVAKHELGVDIEKKVHYRTGGPQAIRFMLTNHPNIHIRRLEDVPLRRSDWFYLPGLLPILATAK